ncbi:MAG: hypothetical protein QXJ75_03745 [Candidatus Bathyarchaeia archaeon]
MRLARLSDMDNRAVSTIVANLLAMAIIVSVGSSLYTWVVTSYGAYQNMAADLISNRSDAARERFIIEKVWFMDTDADAFYEEVKLYIRNIGGVQITVTDVSINGLEISIAPQLPLTLDSGQVKELEIALTEEISKWAVERIDVTSDRGSSIGGYWQAC